MLNAYIVNETLSVNKTNYPINETTYTWRILNNHSSIDLQLNISITIPNATVTDKSLGFTDKGDMHQYVGVLPVGKSLTLYLKFHTDGYGDYTVKNTGIISINEHTLDYNSSKTLQVLQPIVNVYINTTNVVNKSMTVNVWARNDDLTSKYYYLYGILKGISEEEPVNYNVLEPNSLVLVAKKVYNTTGLGIQNIDLVFDGVYRDIYNVDHKLYSEQVVTINVPDGVKSTINSTVNASANTSVIPEKNSTASVIAPKDSNPIPSNSKDVKPAGEKKDVLSRAIEALSEFLQAIFG